MITTALGWLHLVCDVCATRLDFSPRTIETWRGTSSIIDDFIRIGWRISEGKLLCPRCVLCAYIALPVLQSATTCSLIDLPDGSFLVAVGNPSIAFATTGPLKKDTLSILKFAAHLSRKLGIEPPENISP